MPIDTEEERTHKEKVLEETTLIALTTPRDCLALAKKSMGMLLRLIEIGSRLAISDVGVGAECVMAAAKTSLWNIYINTKALLSFSYCLLQDLCGIFTSIPRT